jgi:diacylglycerol kinase family enzyme
MSRGRVPEVANEVRTSSGRAHAPAGSNPAPSAHQTTTAACRLDDVARVVAIVNPAAGGDPHGLLDELLCATPKSVHVEVELTHSTGDAEQIAAEHSCTPSTVVVAVGGDGTVREVAAGIHRAGANAALLVAPAGTGNSSYLGLWNDQPWPTVVHALYDGSLHLRSIDLASIEDLDRIMLLGAGAGVIAQGLISAQSLDGAGRSRLLQAAFDTLYSYPPHHGRVIVDGRVLVAGEMLNVNVGGNRYRAGSFQLLPRSLVDDGLLDVSILRRCPDPLEPALLSMTGDIADHPAVVYGRGRRITVERTDGEALVFEHDGDVVPQQRFSYTISVLPAALRVAVPDPVSNCFSSNDVLTTADPI